VRACCARGLYAQWRARVAGAAAVTRRAARPPAAARSYAHICLLPRIKRVRYAHARPVPPCLLLCPPDRQALLSPAPWLNAALHAWHANHDLLSARRHTASVAAPTLRHSRIICSFFFFFFHVRHALLLLSRAFFSFAQRRWFMVLSSRRPNHAARFLRGVHIDAEARLPSSCRGEWRVAVLKSARRRGCVRPTGSAQVSRRRQSAAEKYSTMMAYERMIAHRDASVRRACRRAALRDKRAGARSSARRVRGARRSAL